MGIANTYVAASSQMASSLRPVTVVQTQTKTADTENNFVFTVDLNSCGFLLVQYNVLKAEAGDEVACCFFNADTTTTNYYSQQLGATNTTVVAGRDNTAKSHDVYANQICVGFGWIYRDIAGRAHGIFYSDYQGPTNIYLSQRHMVTNGTVINVTEIKFALTGGGHFKTGSTISIYTMGK